MLGTRHRAIPAAASARASGIFNASALRGRRGTPIATATASRAIVPARPPPGAHGDEKRMGAPPQQSPITKDTTAIAAPSPGPRRARPSTRRASPGPTRGSRSWSMRPPRWTAPGPGTAHAESREREDERATLAASLATDREVEAITGSARVAQRVEGRHLDLRDRVRVQAERVAQAARRRCSASRRGRTGRARRSPG